MKTWLLGLLLCAGAAAAHEVKIEQTTSAAAVVRLSYADGQAFAFEAYELYPAGEETPAQVGRTDAEGRIVFLPGPRTEWRLKAFSADGHGLNQRLTVTAAAASSTMPARDAPSRWSLLLAGLGIIFGIFGLLQFIQRKKAS
ncbi:MAG TPA: hypothetical protein VJ572_06605 [Azonexus sp.]|nr:hypothetical protein [Azonexus sp.]